MTKYDQKRPTPFDERRRSVTAAETAAREAAREKQRQRLREAQAKANKMPKYRNKETPAIVNGKLQKYPSIHEANRAAELRILQRAGKISNLREQVEYVLIPNQYGENGKLLERKCSYFADFVYVKDGREIVEDAKSEATRKSEKYIIKRKLMLRVFGIRVVEV